MFLSTVANAKYSSDIYLVKDVQVSKKFVNVADVVNVNILSADLLLVLNKIIIAKSPISGYRKKLSKNYIRKLVLNYKAANLSRLNIIGADFVTIKRKSKLIDANDYNQQAKEYLYEQLAKQYTNIELQVVGRNKNIYVPMDNAQLVFTASDTGSIRSRMSVMIEVRENNNFVTKLPVWFKVKAKAIAYELNSDVAESEQVQSNDLKVVLVDALKLTNHPVKNISKLRGLITKKALIRGQLLTQDLLILKPDVINGKSVIVVVKVGNVTLHTKAIAKQSGAIGEIVELYNTSNKEIFKGIVINENYVRSL